MYSIKKFFPICGVLSLFGCSQPAQDLLLDTQNIETVAQSETRDIPASQLLPSNVKFICSLGPYFDVSISDTDQISVKMLSQLGPFPIEEDEGYFVYFDHKEELIKYDKLFRFKKQFRWHRTDANLEGKCIPFADTAFEVTHDQHHYIGLKKNLTAK